LSLPLSLLMSSCRLLLLFLLATLGRVLIVGFASLKSYFEYLLFIVSIVFI
jgi:hypothetical protein